MKTFQTDFYTRLDEINEYFAFITFIDGVETHKQEKLAVGNSTQYVPKRDLQKILRSNSFLLLYNLVESSIRNSILAVYDCIHDEALKYEELSDTIQEIWLINQSKKVQSSDKNVKKWLKSLIEGVSDGGQIILEKDTIVKT